MPPAEMGRDGGEWLEWVGGQVASLGAATHRPEDRTHRELDYFIIDKRIAHTVMRVEVDLSLNIRPHRAVTLAMRPADANQTEAAARSKQWQQL